MLDLPPAIAAYAEALRAQLSPQNCIEESVVDHIVWSAIRLKLFESTPPDQMLTDKNWNNAYTHVQRMFKGSMDSLDKVRKLMKLRAEENPAPPAPAPPPLPPPLPPSPSVSVPSLLTNRPWLVN